MMSTNNRFLIGFLIVLLVAGGFVLVYLFSTESNELTGVLSGTLAAIVTGLTALLRKGQKKEKANSR